MTKSQGFNGVQKIALSRTVLDGIILQEMIDNLYKVRVNELDFCFGKIQACESHQSLYNRLSSGDRKLFKYVIPFSIKHPVDLWTNCYLLCDQTKSIYRLKMLAANDINNRLRVFNSFKGIEDDRLIALMIELTEIRFSEMESN